LVDAAVGAAFFRVRSAADVLLAQIPMNDPCGSVSGVTGQLTFSISGPDASADASGTVAYVEVCDAAGVVHLALPVTTGSVAVAGYAVFNTLSIIAGAPVYMVSATIG
jgi:hypothetical protein